MVMGSILVLGGVVLYASLLIALVVWGMDVCFQNFMEKIVYPH